jgi:hypothetical protein
MKIVLPCFVGLDEVLFSSANCALLSLTEEIVKKILSLTLLIHRQINHFLLGATFPVFASKTNDK